MSTTHTPPAPVSSDSGRPEDGRRDQDDRDQQRPARRRMLRRVTGGVIGVAAITSLTIALWPASEADKARADGEQWGEAVAALAAADSSAEVDAALADLDTAAAETADHAGDAVAEQVEDQEDALARAADGFAGAVTASDEFEADLYEAELDLALDDLTTQAGEFQEQGSDVEQAFWEGFEEGVESSE